MKTREEVFSIHESVAPYADYFMTAQDWKLVDAVCSFGILPEESFPQQELEEGYRRGILNKKHMDSQIHYELGTFLKRLDCCLRGEGDYFMSLPTEVLSAVIAYEQSIDLWVMPYRKPGHNMGVITPLPLEKALEKITQSNCRYFLQTCDCRTFHDDKHHIRESCLHFMDEETILNSNFDRGYARELTKEEAVQQMILLDRDGLVHNWEGHGFCNCCSCCCWAMRGISEYRDKGLPLFDEYIHADYILETDPSKCIGCGLCRDICPVKALSLKEGKIHLDQALCLGCGVCRTRCHKDALKIISRPTNF